MDITLDMCAVSLKKWENDELVVLDIDNDIDELIKLLEVEGFVSFYITKFESFYKTCRYDELLIIILAAVGRNLMKFFKTGFTNKRRFYFRRHFHLRLKTDDYRKILIIM